MERAINMGSFINETLMTMGLSLANLAVKATSFAVNKKIIASKEEKISIIWEQFMIKL